MCISSNSSTLISLYFCLISFFFLGMRVLIHDLNRSFRDRYACFDQAVEGLRLLVYGDAEDYGPDPAKYQRCSIKLDDTVDKRAPVTLAVLFFVLDRVHAAKAGDDRAPARQQDVKNKAKDVEVALERVDL